MIWTWPSPSWPATYRLAISDGRTHTRDHTYMYLCTCTRTSIYASRTLHPIFHSTLIYRQYDYCCSLRPIDMTFMLRGAINPCLQRSNPRSCSIHTLRSIETLNSFAVQYTIHRGPPYYRAPGSAPAHTAPKYRNCCCDFATTRRLAFSSSTACSRA